MWSLAASSGFQDKSTFWPEVSLDILYLGSKRHRPIRFTSEVTEEDVTVMFRQWSFIIRRWLTALANLLWSDIAVRLPSLLNHLKVGLWIVNWSLFRDPPCDSAESKWQQGLLVGIAGNFRALWLTPPSPHALGPQMPRGVQRALQFLHLLH